MGDWLNVLVTAALVALVVWTLARHKQAVSQPAADRPDRPYQVFTRAFDMQVAGREVALQLGAKSLRGPPPDDTELTSEEARREAAFAAFRRASASPDAARLRLSAKDMGQDTSVVLLIDLSGSMTNAIPTIAGQLKAVAETFTKFDVDWALLGFTTAGWRGGMAREAWLRAGKPRYPGRLCAVMHVTYKEFGEPLREDDWEAFLDPRALYENVDGEALTWASSKLLLRSTENRLLIVLSDGAPCDDSTMSENGLEYLWRHRNAVVEQIRSDGQVRLGALILGEHDADCFADRVLMNEPDQLLGALADILMQLQPRTSFTPPAPGSRPGASSGTS